MLKKGDVIENRLTGEKLVFIATTAETQGKTLEFDYFLKPNSPIEAEHFHPETDHKIEVVKGTFTVKINGKISRVAAGCSVIIPPGSPHKGWNAENDELHLKISMSPAMNFEGWYALCSDLAKRGKTSKNGTPDLLQLAVFMYENQCQSYFPRFKGLQKFLVKLAGPIGKRLGYRSSYVS